MITNYLDWKRSYTSHGTYPNYERWVNRFIEFIRKPTSDITLTDVIYFREHLKELEIAPRHVQYGLSIIRDFLSYEVSMGRLNFPLKLFKIKVERAQSHNAITLEEHQAMVKQLPLTSAQNIQRRLILELFWHTGVRVSELLSIQVDELLDGEVIIRNAKNDKRRMVAWPFETERLLQRYLKHRNNIQTSDKSLFIALSRNAHSCLTSRQIQRIVKKLAENAGITRKISPHSWRHGFTHRKLHEGKPITTVAQMLGHSTSLNVLTYAQLSSKELREAWSK